MFKKNKLNALFTVIAFLMISLAPALSLGGTGEGGGDYNAQEFVELAKKISLWLSKQDSKLRKEFRQEEIQNYVEILQKSLNDEKVKDLVEFSANKLFNSQNTEKPAIVNPETGLIKVYRLSWWGMTDQEKLATVGCELTYYVGISNRYEKVSDVIAKNYIQILELEKTTYSQTQNQFNLLPEQIEIESKFRSIMNELADKTITTTRALKIFKEEIHKTYSVYQKRNPSMKEIFATYDVLLEQILSRMNNMTEDLLIVQRFNLKDSENFNLSILLLKMILRTAVRMMGQIDQSEKNIEEKKDLFEKINTHQNLKYFPNDERPISDHVKEMERMKIIFSPLKEKCQELIESISDDLKFVHSFRHKN